ncbi:MAG: ROK family protein [Ignavibacteriales bacterium]
MPVLAAGVDIGGSHVSVGIVDCEKRLVARRTAGHNHVGSPSKVSRLAADLLEDCLEECSRCFGGDAARLTGVGIGVPGLVKQPSGIVAIAPNLGWKEVDAASEFRRALGSFTGNIAIDNDANLAALGEWAAGAGAGRRVVVCITLGTGIGGGIVVDGLIYHGALGFAGEIGHIKVFEDGPPCACGGRGCLETLASGTAIGRAGSRALGRDVTAREVFDAAREGDERAAAVVTEAARSLGAGISTVANILNPHVVVLGGAVALAGEVLLRPAVEEMRRLTMAPAVPELVTAALGLDAAIIGGAALFLRCG